MNKSKLLIAAAAASLSFSQVAVADAGGDNWSISGWINEGVTYFDDGVGSNISQESDNGTTLGSRITLSGSTDLPNSGLNAGFEVILEPLSRTTPLIFSNQATFGQDDAGHAIGVLGSSINIGGGFGKLTVGLQSMPTDNIAVLEDPSLTLWSGISPVFRGNGFAIQNTTGVNTTWGSFLSCMGSNALTGIGGIGIDCNGVYRKGVRWDLPNVLGPLNVAVGYANDDIYDVAVKYKGDLGGLTSQLAVGYSYNATGGAYYGGRGSDTIQVQGGLMDAGTGLFGSVAYQSESAEGVGPGLVDDTDAYWIKVGIKKGFNSLGDTSISFDFGDYSDQFGAAAGATGVTGSSVERMGIAVDQYFGSRLIIYGKWENLDLDVDCAAGTACVGAYSSAEDLDTFTTGLTFFF